MAPSRRDLNTAISAYWAAKEDQKAAAEAIRSTAEGTNRAGLTGREKPWLGYFFLLDDSPEARQPREPRTNPAIPTAPEWPALSFQDRFSLTGRRLVDEGLYDAVCYVTASEAEPTPTEPEPLLDWRHFSAAIEARLTYLSKLGLP